MAKLKNNTPEVLSCPTINDIQICSDHLEPLAESCIANLIKEAEALSCQTLTAHEPIVDELTEEYVVAIQRTTL